MIIKRRRIGDKSEIKSVPIHNGYDPMVRELRMVSGSFYLPKDNGLKPDGEDASFMCRVDQVVGVADGVGSWALKGIDAGEYARQLMRNCVATIESKDSRNYKFGRINLKRVLKQAYANTKVEGSSTACLLSLSGSKLHAVNLGDSGFMVLREGIVVYQSPLQQHCFNCPYQLGNHQNSDKPSSAQELEVEVKSGDIIVAATDGLLDNAFLWEIERAINFQLGRHQKSNAVIDPEMIAMDLVELALYNAYDEFKDTPFSSAAKQAGKKHTGGKIDDITVVVSFVL
ncbi:PPM-type phosphatase-like domain [Dillenia turbinata]|uniref:Protein phosphatase n=1 Tax=Dillenia turbinata TaxID=194707 RepID=A0AAN8W1U3_9MAGN